LEVYLDLVMVLNFLVDFLLLLGTNRLAGFPLGVSRCAYGALLGSVYSGACLLNRFRFLGSFLWRLGSLGMMALIAFGCSRSAVKWAYPAVCAVLFLPTVPIYYNSSALIHAVWYLVLAAVGLAIGSGIGALVRRLRKKA